MIKIIEKVEQELNKMGLTIDEVENEHILEACTAKVALVDNLEGEGISFDELEEQMYPDSTFVNTMVQHLDDGGSGEDIISAFLLGAMYYSPELREKLNITEEDE